MKSSRHALFHALAAVILLLAFAASATPQTLTINPSPVIINVPLPSATQPVYGTATVTILNGATPVSGLAPRVDNPPSWLLGFTGSTQPGTYTATVYAVPGTAAGTYTTSLIFTGSGFSQTTLEIRMVVGSATSSTLSASPSQLNFSYQPGGAAPASQQLIVSSTTGAAAVTFSSTQVWLTWTASSSVTPLTLNVAVNTSLITGTGTLNGTIVVTPAAGGSALQIPVTLQVGGVASPLTATPTSLTYDVQVGGSSVDKTVDISSATPLAVSIQPSAVGWMTVTANQLVTPLRLTVRANPTGLTAGTYSTNIVVTPSTGSALSIAVTVNVGAQPQVTLSTNAVNLAYQVGTSVPPRQTVTITSGGSTLFFLARAPSPTVWPSWLVVTPLSGSTLNGQIEISVASSALAGLAQGNYTADIEVFVPGAQNPSQVIRVTLQVSLLPLLTANVSSLSFTQPLGGAVPAGQAVQVTSSNQTAAIPFAVTATTSSGGNWLLVNAASGTTPATVTVSLSSVAATLPPGTYSGAVNFTSVSAGNPLSVGVTLRVTNDPVLTSTVPGLTFNYQIGQAAPALQTLQVNSTGAPISFTVATSLPSGQNWLVAIPNSTSTPSTVSVVASTAGMTPGKYEGSIVVTPQGSTTAALTIPVTYNVSNTALLNVGAPVLNFTFSPGGNIPDLQLLSLTSTDPANQLNFTVEFATSSGFPWLYVLPLSGRTPDNVRVGVQPSNLTAGVHNGTVTIRAANANTTVVPVVLTIGVTTNLAANPTQLAFTQVSGGSAPAAQSVQVSATGTQQVNFTATATTSIGGAWLSVTPSGGTTPATLNISVNGSPGGVALLPGAYNGEVTVQSSPGIAPLRIPVAFTIAQAVPITVGPASLSFSAQAGAAAPAAQTINITGTSLPFTVEVSTTSGGNWLSATPTTGTTPANVSVAVKTDNLAAGTYSGQVTIKSSAASNSPQNIAVTLVVTGIAVGPMNTVINSASALPGALSPGEIISIKGTNLGPATGVETQLDSSGRVATTLADTRVLFDGFAGPLTFVRADQINVVVPYEVAGRFSVRVEVEYKGVKSAPLTFQVTDAAPGVFCNNMNGTGQAAALNQDFTRNGPSNPAARGTVITLYATGEGQTIPAGVTGSVTPTRVGSVAELKKPALQVAAAFGGIPAVVEYAGAAPGFVSGALQINLRIPMNAPTGNEVAVFFSVGNKTSQGTATVAIR